tara:strand:+ start:28110 stop:29819 length:1710 start_codon:yes stop_codon:yes gene_type:complete
MKIKKCAISKFRSIEYGEFTIEGVIGIVGQNNAGKSAVLKALNSFFNPDEEIQSYQDGLHLYSTNRAVPRITITFSNVPPNQPFSVFVSNSELVIKQEYNKKKRALEYFVLNNGTFQAMTDELFSAFSSCIQFILIPTNRTATNIAKSEVSALKRLLDSFFTKHTARRDTLTPKVRETFRYFQNNALKKVSFGIEDKYLAKRGFSIQIDSRVPLSYDLFINELTISINEEGKEFKLEECGSGIQSLVIMSIHKYLAELENTNFIVGIEEPEINLHPQAQKELVFSLLDEVNQSDSQVIFATHSTVMVDQLDHTDILLVRKTADNNRSFKSEIFQLRRDFWSHYNLQRMQYDKFHKFRNSEFFFANHVLVTESPIDSEVFSVLLNSKGIVLEREGISILELGGITSLKYAFYLLRDLKLPKTIIVDKDFFFEYQNGRKDNSRYGSGFFNYSNTYRNEDLISEIITGLQKRTILEGLLTSNHSRALDITIEYDVVCMKYNMEMDLVASTVAQTLICDYLNIPANERNTHNLLVNNEKAIKKLDLLNHVISNLPHRNLPNSYKRLIRRIREL